MWVSRRVIQALREQSGMSMPIRGAVDFSGVRTTSFVEMLANGLGAGVSCLLAISSPRAWFLVVSTRRIDRSGVEAEMPLPRKLESRWLHT